MTGAFEWINQIWEMIRSLFPQMVIVSTVEGGVAFVRGGPKGFCGILPGKVKEIPSGGVFIYWPFWTTVLIVPTARQTLNIPAQTLPVKVGKTYKAVSMEPVVIYRIKDPVRALAHVHDIDDAISDIIRGQVVSFLWHRTMSSVLGMPIETLCSDLKDAISKRLSRKYGIHVEDVLLANVSPASVLVVRGSEVIPMPEGLE